MGSDLILNILYVIGIVYVIGVTIYIVMENRRPQSAFAWLFLFMLFPIL